MSIRVLGIVPFVAILLSGCSVLPGSPGHDVPLSRPYGLGLELPEVYPQPGPFVEERDHLETLEDFLMTEGREILLECGSPGDANRLEYLIGRELHLTAFRVLINGCLPIREVEALVDQAMSTHTEDQMRSRLLNETEEGLEAWKQLLSAHPGPGNRVEAQLIAIAASHYVFTVNTRIVTEHLWGYYEDGTDRSELQLESAFMGYVSPMQKSERIQEIFSRYPWSDEQCEPPDQDMLVARIEGLISQAQQEAAYYGHDEVQGERQGVVVKANGTIISYPGRQLYTDSAYNDLMNTHIPRFETMRENGWWAGLMRVEGSVRAQLGYRQALELPAWPTLEEAYFLYMDHRNESRNMWHEYAFGPYRDRLEDEEARVHFPDWEEQTDAAPRFLGLLSTPWPYEGLDCPS